jgi:AbrB family looped-hinge helix DNA binding protein
VQKVLSDPFIMILIPMHISIDRHLKRSNTSGKTYQEVSAMPKVTSKGQVTIPHQIRTVMRIRAGDEVIFEIDEAKVLLKKKRTSIENLRKYVGFLTHLDGKKTDEIMNELRGEVNDFSC